MDGSVDKLAGRLETRFQGSGRLFGFEPVRDEGDRVKSVRFDFLAQQVQRARLLTYLSLYGPSTRWADPGKLVSLYLSGRQFANDLVSCVALIRGSTETTMMIVVIAALVVFQTSSDVNLQ